MLQERGRNIEKRDEVPLKLPLFEGVNIITRVRGGRASLINSSWERVNMGFSAPLYKTFPFPLSRGRGHRG